MGKKTLINTNVKVAIFEDHLSIVDGYLYRFSMEPKIQVVATIFFGEELEPTLAQHQVDVLLLAIQVPVSKFNPNPYPVLHSVSSIIQNHPNINILAISMYTEAVLIRALVDAGISGYIYKNDYASIKQLSRIIFRIANGETYFSAAAYQHIHPKESGKTHPILSHRQIEVMSLCASYPDESTVELAARLGVAGSTVRNLLSNAYVRLGIHTRAAAIAKVIKMGLLSDSSKFK